MACTENLLKMLYWASRSLNQFLNLSFHLTPSCNKKQWLSALLLTEPGPVCPNDERDAYDREVHSFVNRDDEEVPPSTFRIDKCS